MLTNAAKLEFIPTMRLCLPQRITGRIIESLGDTFIEFVMVENSQLVVGISRLSVTVSKI